MYATDAVIAAGSGGDVPAIPGAVPGAARTVTLPGLCLAC